MMKYILITFLCFAALSSVGQTFPSGFPTQFNTGWQKWGYSQSDSGTIIARRDTAWTPTYAGTIVLWRQASDTSYFFYTGQRWIKLLKQGDVLESTNLYGTIYNKNNWNDLTGFINQGTDAIIAANKISFTTGATNFSQYLSVDTNSMLERWAMSVIIRIDEKSATSNGAGIGMISSNSFVGSNAIGTFNMSTGGNSGKVQLYLYNNSLTKTSTNAISFSVNDYISLTLFRNVDTITVIARNVTTNSTPIYITHQYSFNNTPFIHNTGRFSLFPLGGGFTVDSINVISVETKRADVLIIGDSKSQGYNTSNQTRRYGELLHSNFQNVVIHAGSGDRITDALDAIYELKRLNSRQVLLAIGRNDIAEGIDSNTIKTNYQALVDSLSDNTVFHLLPFYETTVDQEWFKNYIQRTFTNVIDTWSPILNCANCVASDNVHLTDYGNVAVYDAIINSFLLTGGKNIDQWGLKRVLQYNDSANNKIILGPSKRNGSTQSAAFSQPLLHITNTSYPSINLHTASTSSSSGGGSLIWRGAVSGSKLQSSIFGDSAFFAIVAQQAAADSRNLAFFMSDTGATYYIPFNLRSTKADFLGQRQRPTAEAWYNLFAGVNLAGTSNFGATNAVFAVNAANYPVDLYNLPSVAIDTNIYKPLVRNSSGLVYSSFWPNFSALANQGLTKAGDTIQLGGDLYKNAIVGNIGQNFGVTFNRLGTSAAATVTAVSSVGTALNATTTSGTALVARSSSGLGGLVGINPSTTNTLDEVFRLERNSSGSAANDIGGYLSYTTKTSDGSLQQSGRIGTVWTDVTTGTRTSRMDFWTQNSATISRKMSISGPGQLTLDGYPALTQSIDTTNHKPLGYNTTTGVVEPMANWPVGSGGSGGSGFGIDSTVIGGTSGSVLFVGSDGSLQQNNANLFFDSTNVRLGIGTSTIAAGYRIQANGGAILTTNGTTGGAILQGNAATPYVALGTFADPISYLQIQSSGGVNNINTKARNLRIFSTAATVGLTFNQATGEIFNGSTSDFGAFLFQNTGGLYQNGTFSLNGTETGLTTDLILVKGTDSVVRTIAAPLNGSATLDFGSTSPGSSTDLTITVTGAADGDVVALGVPNGSTLANGCFTAWVSAANTVTVRFTNNDLVTSLDPASGTFKVKTFK